MEQKAIEKTECLREDRGLEREKRAREGEECCKWDSGP
jgi:hypothetical protein